MRTSFIAPLFAAAALTGCAAGLISIDGEADGVVYHLPRTVLEITVRQYQDGETIWYSLGGPAPAADDDEKAAAFSEIKPHIIPDIEHRYVIKYNPSALSDDRLCISRSPNGLLQDVQFAADDRTPQVVFNIARFLGGFVGGGSPVAYFKGETKTGKFKVRSHTGKVDPYSDADIRGFNNALSQVFASNIKIDVSALRRISAETANSAPKHACTSQDGCPQWQWKPRCDEDHICYRSTLKLPIHLNSNGQRIDVKYADVVSAWDIGTISVTRAFLVQKITKLKFEDGALVSAIIRKPSEVEEVSLLPLNVMNAILSVPTGLWTAALADNKFKQDAIAQLASQNEEIKNIKDTESLLLQGAGPIGPLSSTKQELEHYTLNCMTGREVGALNILGAGG